MTDAGHEDYALLLFGLAAMGFVFKLLVDIETIYSYVISFVLVILAGTVIVCALTHYWRWHAKH